MKRPVTLTAAQPGAASFDIQGNVNSCLKLVDEASKDNPDYIVFPELCTTPYWCTGTNDPKFFEWAEPIPGPATDAFAKKAKEYGCHIILPIYERGRVAGEFFNTAVVLGPDGNLVYGTLPDGTKVYGYRKNNIGLATFKDLITDEVFYMGKGFGYPMFKTPKADIGILICYDRWFPEAWRVLALQGAEIVFVPVASAGFRTESFTYTLRTWASQNQVFAVGCNRGGVENVERECRYYGLSCIIGPVGAVIKQGPEAEGPTTVSATVDLAELEDVRRGMPFYKDRRPEIYGPITRIT